MARAVKASLVAAGLRAGDVRSRLVLGSDIVMGCSSLGFEPFTQRRGLESLAAWLEHPTNFPRPGSVRDRACAGTNRSRGLHINLGCSSPCEF